jgi:hypothetical protein
MTHKRNLVMKIINTLFTRVSVVAGMCLVIGASVANAATHAPAHINLSTTTDPVVIQVSLPEQIISADVQLISVPVTVGDVSEINVLSYQFEVNFDPTILSPVQTNPFTSAGTMSSEFSIVANPFLPGRLLVAAYSAYPLTGEGTLLNLNFQVIGRIRTPTQLVWHNFMFNEGNPYSEMFDGSVMTRSRRRLAGPRRSF